MWCDIFSQCYKLLYPQREFQSHKFILFLILRESLQYLKHAKLLIKINMFLFPQMKLMFIHTVSLLLLLLLKCFYPINGLWNLIPQVRNKTRFYVYFLPYTLPQKKNKNKMRLNMRFFKKSKNMLFLISKSLFGINEVHIIYTYYATSYFAH